MIRGIAIPHPLRGIRDFRKAPKAGAKDPLLTIGEVRKSALNAVQ